MTRRSARGRPRFTAFRMLDAPKLVAAPVEEESEEPQGVT